MNLLNKLAFRFFPPGKSATVTIETPEDLLIDLVERSGTHDLTVTVRRALSLYDLLLEYQAEGSTVEIAHKDGTRERLKV